MPTVYERVKTIVVDKLGVDEAEVSEQSSFVENLNADADVAGTQTSLIFEHLRGASPL